MSVWCHLLLRILIRNSADRVALRFKLILKIKYNKKKIHFRSKTHVYFTVEFILFRQSLVIVDDETDTHLNTRKAM